MMLPKQEHAKLCEQIRKHDRLYYGEAKPTISDSEYDALVRRVIQLEQENPELVTIDSPSRRVGGCVNKEFKTGVHVQPMLSLDNIYEMKELESRLGKMLDLTCHPHVEQHIGSPTWWVVEPKVDGASLSLHYNADGLLCQALTRGTGTEGDDITDNVRTIRNIPLKIQTWGRPMHVRGEVFMTFDDFRRINEKRIAAGEEKFMNPRNAAAGALKLLDSTETAKRPLRFVPYTLISDADSAPQSQWMAGTWLAAVGFMVMPMRALCKNVETVLEVVTKFEALKRTLPFPVDGAVVKIDAFELRPVIGEGTRAPKWAYAYKYAPDEAETRLNGITFQVGRTGIIAPVAELEPVELAGSTVKRASIFNQTYIEEKDVRVGDTIIIAKAGEIIPEVQRVVIRDGVERGPKFKFITHCPCCDTRLVRQQTKKGEGAAWVCTNYQGCHEQIRGRLEYWCAKAAMDIQTIGPETISQLYGHGQLKTVVDLYELTVEKLRHYGFGPNEGKNMLAEIEVSKDRGMERVLIGLGIPRCGEGTAKRLARAFPDLRTLATTDKAGLLAVQDIGDLTASSLRDWLSNPINIALMASLEAKGVDLKSKSYNPASANGVFKGKTFVFTGELTSMERPKAQRLVEDKGGRCTGSVSKKTHYVVVGNEPGRNKTSKAQELNIPMIDENAFLKMLEEANQQ